MNPTAKPKCARCADLRVVQEFHHVGETWITQTGSCPDCCWKAELS